MGKKIEWTGKAEIRKTELLAASKACKPVLCTIPGVKRESSIEFLAELLAAGKAYKPIFLPTPDVEREPSIELLAELLAAGKAYKPTF